MHFYEQNVHKMYNIFVYWLQVWESRIFMEEWAGRNVEKYCHSSPNYRTICKAGYSQLYLRNIIFIVDYKINGNRRAMVPSIGS